MAQQQPNLNSNNVIAHDEFFRLPGLKNEADLIRVVQY